LKRGKWRVISRTKTISKAMYETNVKFSLILTREELLIMARKVKSTKRISLLKLTRGPQVKNLENSKISQAK